LTLVASATLMALALVEVKTVSANPTRSLIMSSS
jgi:hypothetical protein